MVVSNVSPQAPLSVKQMIKIPLDSSKIAVSPCDTCWGSVDAQKLFSHSYCSAVSCCTGLFSAVRCTLIKKAHCFRILFSLHIRPSKAIHVHVQLLIVASSYIWMPSCSWMPCFHNTNSAKGAATQLHTKVSSVCLHLVLYNVNKMNKIIKIRGKKAQDPEMTRMLALLLATHDLFVTTHPFRKNLPCSQPISIIDK